MTMHIWQPMVMSRSSNQAPPIRSAFAAFAREFSVPPRNPQPEAPETTSAPTREPSPPETPTEPAEPLYVVEVPDEAPAASARARVAKLRDLHNRLTSPVDGMVPDWRAALAGPIAEQNIEAVKQAGVIPAQFKVLELSQEAESEQIQLQASQFILAQNGHGAIQKTEQKVEYEQVPVDQLTAIIRAKLHKIRTYNPSFDLSQITEIPAVPELPAPAES